MFGITRGRNRRWRQAKRGGGKLRNFRLWLPAFGVSKGGRNRVCFLAGALPCAPGSVPPQSVFAFRRDHLPASGRRAPVLPAWRALEKGPGESPLPIASLPRLKNQFQAELQFPHVNPGTRRRDGPEGAASCNRHALGVHPAVPQIQVGIPEIRVVEKIKRFEPELNISFFGEVEVFQCGEIPVENARTNDYVPARVSIRVQRWKRKRGDIEPLASVKMEFICQPPMSLPAKPWFRNGRPFPKGRS